MSFVRAKTRGIGVVLAAVLFCHVLPSLAEGEHYQVDGIQVSGNTRVDTAAIEAQIKSKKGTVSSDQISEDVKTLYKSGYFDNVTVSAVSADGKHLLRFAVIEKPVVRKVFIKGNKEVSEKDLADALTFQAQRFLDRAHVQTLIKNATTLYQSRGYYDAKFDYSVVPVGENEVDVTFTVDEGKAYKIKAIRFRGLSTIDPGELRAAIQTKKYKWWNSWLLGTGRLNQEMLENDKALVRQYFLNNGYLDATLGEPTIEKHEDNKLVIDFEVNEGRVYTVGAVSASGDLVDGSVEKTIADIKTAPGKTFNAGEVRDDSFTVSEKFSDKGYAFANVVPQTVLNRDTSTVDLQFAVDKGKLVTVNRINIHGNNKTYDHVIRRELKIGEQETFSSSKVKRSEELLRRLGYFEEASINTEPIDKPDKVDLGVNVREGSTGTFSAGAGYSSSDGAIFNTRLSEDNILGTGKRANINFDLGTERQNLIVSLEDRRVNDSYWSAGVDGLMTERDFSDFDRKLTGGAFTAGYPLEEVFGESFQDISFSTKYELLQVDISNINNESAAPLVLQSEGTSVASGITPRLVRNTIDNPLNPTKGSRQALDVELTGLGGDQRFYLFEFRQQAYQPLFKTDHGDLIGSWRFSIGYGDTFNGDPFPLYRHFFPGGINSVRGYKNRRLGPRDENGNEYGGSKEIVNNLELIFPLVNSAGLKGLVFYDFGQAYDDDQTITLADLRHAYGFGIRWNSPLGPIRIEFGLPINRKDGDKSFVPMFSFGAPL